LLIAAEISSRRVGDQRLRRGDAGVGTGHQGVGDNADLSWVRSLYSLGLEPATFSAARGVKYSIGLQAGEYSPFLVFNVITVGPVRNQASRSCRR
jgi:hypothetical protein